MTYESPSLSTIPHYHGDKVRFLFLIVTALGFVGIPFWGHLVPYGTLFEVLGGITLIILAGLINPRGRGVMVLSIMAAGFGAFLLEVFAISYHAQDSIQLLLARQAGALMLGAALYFAVKTLRAMAQGKIGEWPRPREFETGTEEQR